jgi:hypothetical protein
MLRPHDETVHPACFDAGWHLVATLAHNPFAWHCASHTSSGNTFFEQDLGHPRIRAEDPVQCWWSHCHKHCGHASIYSGSSSLDKCRRVLVAFQLSLQSCQRLSGISFLLPRLPLCQSFLHILQLGCSSRCRDVFGGPNFLVSLTGVCHLK